MTSSLDRRSARTGLLAVAVALLLTACPAPPAPPAPTPLESPILLTVEGPEGASSDRWQTIDVADSGRWAAMSWHGANEPRESPTASGVFLLEIATVALTRLTSFIWAEEADEVGISPDGRFVTWAANNRNFKELGVYDRASGALHEWFVEGDTESEDQRAPVVVPGGDRAILSTEIPKKGACRVRTLATGDEEPCSVHDSWGVSSIAVSENGRYAIYYEYFTASYFRLDAVNGVRSAMPVLDAARDDCCVSEGRLSSDGRYFTTYDREFDEDLLVEKTVAHRLDLVTGEDLRYPDPAWDSSVPMSASSDGGLVQVMVFLEQEPWSTAQVVWNPLSGATVGIPGTCEYGRSAFATAIDAMCISTDEALVPGDTNGTKDRYLVPIPDGL